MKENTPKNSSSFLKVLIRLIGFVRPFKGLFFSGMMLTIIISFVSPLKPFLMQYVLDNPVAEGNVSELRFWILVLISLVIFQSVLTYYQIWVTNLLGQNVINAIRIKVFNHLLTLRMRYFDKTPIGAIQTRTISDIQTLNNIFTEGLVSIIGELLQLVTLLAIMFYTDWRLTLVIMTILPLLVLATWVFKLRVSEAFNRVRKYVSELNTFLQEHISGIVVTQLFHREKIELNKFYHINKKHKKAHLDTILYYSIFFPVIEIISALALALLVWFGSGGVLAGYTTFGALVAFLMYIQMFFRPIRMLADQFNSLQLGVVSAERIFSVLDNTEIIVNPSNGQKNINPTPASIHFKEVSFKYHEDSLFILNKVSFDVPAGSTTAIVGATGAGKSSIINVLMRFYDIQNGTILINQTPITQIDIQTLRKSMGLVMQDVFLFSGTIFDNITLRNPEISFDAVRKAAEQIGAHSFIEKLPDNYFFNVGERGAALSSGQRQLVTLIRVLVYNPGILLFDEATANIDTVTESIIQNAISKVLKNRTAIIIAHRLSTIQRADNILVMKQGQIVEQGNHQSLLQLDGYYKKLYLLQYSQASVIQNG